MERQKTPAFPSPKSVVDLGSRTANFSVSQGGKSCVSVANSVLNFSVIV